ncbi:ATP-dependent nuclease [Vibrio parahaemolyticus]|uniref:ATP-dependent nuclease n=1 Tax=Vibrio parahaemolyticus TaxID=670 RepID=UPI0004206327|nr:AAA family ATPase [Vibrio parahaemolyticus]
MKIINCSIKNFRRLESVSIEFETDETVFVGPNNAGKTSAASAFRCFVGGKEFSVHDISVSRISDVDEFGQGNDEKELPSIELDLWFSIDPDQISFGRAFTLLPELSEDLDKVGIRLKYKPRDPVALRAAFWEAYPEQEDRTRSASLSQFLGADSNFSRYYELAYYSLDGRDDLAKESRLDSKEGKALLRDLLRVDFLDAQRSVNDDESSRSSRLSTAFSAFYKSNLDQAEAEESAYQVVDENNKRLTEHYEKHFGGLMKVIKGLGIPSVNDRELKVISSLSPLEALQGNTDLIYVDREHQHELPESYNGLGFKNLIYMAIQISHFHIQWRDTEQNRPLCQLIFIEEPEVHLHAQVQQAFIGNIWEMLSKTSDDGLVPQLVVSTHSSHILDLVDFEKVRYFERCELDGEDRSSVETLSASKVRSLRHFVPEAVDAGEQEIDSGKAKSYLLRYLRLTHCDLFFADAAILIEGSVEKLLLPQMIEKSAPELRNKYLSILEVGGAYAHRFAGLLRFLNIPYLVITDLDSVDPEGRHSAVRGDKEGALTSNNSLKTLLGVSTVQELLALSGEQKTCNENDRFVAFQTVVNVEEEAGNSFVMTPRTLEEAFAYDNFALLRNGELSLGIQIPASLDDAYDAVFTRVKSSSFKKTDFALEILFSESEWRTPKYIEEGLKWLDQRLKHSDQTAQHEED